MTIEVRPAEVEEILPLRKAVLRPMEPVVASEYDGYPQVFHVGAFDSGQVIGCATVFPSPYPAAANTEADPGAVSQDAHAVSRDAHAVSRDAGAVSPDAYAWQLRGMAVDPQRQGTGIGGQVLAAAIDLVRAAGASALWANARCTALPFYTSMGFQAVSEEFVYGPSELPHKRILLTLGT